MSPRCPALQAHHRHDPLPEGGLEKPHCSSLSRNLVRSDEITRSSNADVSRGAVSKQTKEDAPSSLWDKVAESILVMAPMLFVVFGIMIFSVNGQPTKASKLGNKLEVIAKLGPTIFPLLFAAVATRSMKVLGRITCQRGTRLGTVELLIASRSVWGTLETQVLLRRCTVIGAQLVLLWSFSPLGGQASLRALQRSELVTKYATELRYLYTGPYATYLTPDTQGQRYIVRILVSLLGSSVDRRVAPNDEWGNIRVPRLEGLPGYTPPYRGWLPVPKTALPEQYSSLLGVPVGGLPATTSNLTVEYRLETSYMSLACRSWESFLEGDPRLATYTNIWKHRDPFRLRKGERDSLYTDQNVTFFIDRHMPSTVLHNASSVDDASPRRLHFVSAHRNTSSPNNTLSATTCSVTESHVEVAIACSAGHNCLATKMRRSLIDTRPEFQVPLQETKLMNFIARDMAALEKSREGRSTLTEVFLWGGTTQQRTAGTSSVNLSEVPPSLFALRLQLVLNAWYLMSLVGEGSVFVGDNPDPNTNPAAYGFDFANLPPSGNVSRAVVNESCKLFCSRSTQATLSRSVEVFSYSKLWLGLLFLCSAVLLATGVAGTVLSRYTLAPDMLGYVASMTYNNRYLTLPDSVSGELDAMRRVRILRNLRVSLSDVCGDEEVGRLAFTANPDVRALERGRKYV